VYESIEGLRAILDEHPDDGMRELFEHHRGRIAGAVGGSGVTATETTVAGFLNGFLTAALRLADDVDAMADSIDPYLGGIYLYASDSLGNHVAADGDVDFLRRLADSVEKESAYRDLAPEERATAVRLVEDVFGQTPDVPVNAASLAGFALGVLYAAPFIARSPGADAAALLGAVTTLARRG
jgi:hypothetical protein